MFPNVSCCIWLLEFVGKYLKAFGMSSDLENLEVYIVLVLRFDTQTDSP